MIVLIGVSAVLFPMYAFMRTSNIPIWAQTYQASSAFVNSNSVVTSASYTGTNFTGFLPVTCEFPIFAIAVMNFLGWIMFMVFMPLGQWGLFFDNFFTFIHRPKPMKEDEFNRAKAELAKKV